MTWPHHKDAHEGAGFRDWSGELGVWRMWTRTRAARMQDAGVWGCGAAGGETASHNMTTSLTCDHTY